MDLRVVWTACSALFLAELGDKTQLAVLTLVASTRQPLAVFVGSAIALLLVTALGVLFGQGLTRLVPQVLLHKAAALAFVAIGIVMLVRK